MLALQLGLVAIIGAAIGVLLLTLYNTALYSTLCNIYKYKVADSCNIFMKIC